MKITKERAKTIGDRLKIKWDKYPLCQFAKGMNVEQEHGPNDKQTDVTKGSLTKTAKIVLAHLKEMPDYYSRLAKMEKHGKKKGKK